MFQSVGWAEILILVVAALVILGPERLPGAISWVMNAFRKVKDYAGGASNELQDQLGTDFDSIREPIAQLNELRQMTPRAVITKHLFDGDSSTLDSMESEMGRLESSVRDSLSDVPTTSRPAGPRPAAGRNHEPQPPAVREPAVQPKAAPAARRHDVTDWDAT
ncbi:Sec-independent protein translocase protein TatB [Gordonia sp. VNK21]|uniref:Sec-independent protein translocase protein TatB n=1 Tax=Gordonia sp. VNK21 TaxID=3382483 RepID=UPI0038D48B06